jgi:hypothetical protein
MSFRPGCTRLLAAQRLIANPRLSTSIAPSRLAEVRLLPATKRTLPSLCLLSPALVELSLLAGLYVLLAAVEGEMPVAVPETLRRSVRHPAVADALSEQGTQPALHEGWPEGGAVGAKHHQPCETQPQLPSRWQPWPMPSMAVADGGDGESARVHRAEAALHSR